jgi:ATP-binding cassette subfamily B protein
MARSAGARASLIRFLEIAGTSTDRMARVWLGLAAATVTLGGAAAALAPLMLARLIDSQVNHGRGEWEFWLGAYLAALASQRLLEQVQAFAYGRGEQRLIRRLGARAFTHMLRLPLGFHVEQRSGALAQTLNDAALGVRLVLFHLVMTIAPVLVQLAVACLVVLKVFDARLAVTLVTALLTYAGLFAWGVVRQAAPANAISAAQLDAGGLTGDGLMNVEAVKTFAAEDHLADRYDDVLARREAHWRAFLKARLHNGLAVAMVFAGALGLTLLLAARSVEAGGAALGAFVLVNAYVLQLVRPIELLGFAARDIGQGAAYLRNLVQVLDQTPEPRTGANGRVAPGGAAELVFDGVTFAYGPARPVLSGVSFRAPPGAVIGIVGPSGVGKTTLLRLILRFYDPQGGSIRLDGVPLSEIPLAELRRQVAIVSQDTILLNDTIAENLRLAWRDAPLGALVAALDAAGLHDLTARLPEGLNTRVGERGLMLSGGEKQRVSMARAALKRARLVLFDEATAALDPGTEHAVWKGMRKSFKGVTTLIVTHRLATVADADEILVVDKGRVLERGRHETLLATGGRYAELWRVQRVARAPGSA